MQIIPVDQNNNIFQVMDVFSSDLVTQVLATPWLEIKHTKQEGQESWKRRRILTDELTWFPEWDQQIQKLWPQLEHNLGVKLEPYSGTGFWLDEPGFICPIHTDGEMPGSFHLTWVGKDNHGTTFYNSKNVNDVRYQVEMKPNAGYAMINLPDDTGYRMLQWHGMMHPVPINSYRLTSYTWLYPCK